MQRGRLEAFSDGVMAIIITLMAFELHLPAEPTLNALLATSPVFSSYVLSFAFVGIYWNNHHHLFQAVRRIDGASLWANLHLLFWLSLIPFVSEWMGKSHFAPLPVLAYGVVLLMAAIAYYVLSHVLLRCQGTQSALDRALGADFKGQLSMGAYALGVLVALWLPLIALALYVLVALLWLMPDRRIEAVLMQDDASN